MKKSTVVTVVNQKGGVGKTSIAAAVAQFWSVNLDVLLVDLDPQGSASSIFLDEIGTNAFDTLTGTVPVEKVIVSALPQYPPRLKIMPAGQSLSELGAMLAGKIDRFHVVQDVVGKLDDFDIIVIDCPGTLSLLTLAPLVAADFALLPTSAEPLSYDAIGATIDSISTVQRRLNPGLRLLPLVVTLYDTRNRLDAEVLAELKARHDVFDTVVHRRVRIKEQLAARQACTSADLKKLATEILERIRHEQKCIQAKAYQAGKPRQPR
jgi:chromosome partitioning protein